MAMAPKEFNDKRLFGGNREIAIQRDGEKCLKCGMTRVEHKRRYGYDITVDHIDGNGSGKPAHLKNNNLDNLQTLCIRCHVRKDNKQNKLTDSQVAGILHLRGSMSNNKIAKLYGVSRMYVSMLMRKQWRKNVTDVDL